MIGHVASNGESGHAAALTTRRCAECRLVCSPENMVSNSKSGERKGKVDDQQKKQKKPASLILYGTCT